jgi:hypothetical protein
VSAAVIPRYECNEMFTTAHFYLYSYLNLDVFECQTALISFVRRLFAFDLDIPRFKVIDKKMQHQADIPHGLRNKIVNKIKS